MCMCVSVKSIIMVTRLDVVFSYVKHVAISCVLLIYGYVMFGVSHGGQPNQQIKARTHTHTHTHRGFVPSSHRTCACLHLCV
jgi:hypothetical protein